MKISILLPLSFLPICFAASEMVREENAPKGAAKAISQSMPLEPYAKPARKRKLLVFSKTAGFRHESIPTGKLAFSEMGKKTGAFECIVSDDLTNFDAATIKGFDAVMFLNTSLDPFGPTEAKQMAMTDQEKIAAIEKSLSRRKSLMDFVKAGGGFVGIHAATDTFYNWPEYGEMIGGYFDGHPWSASTEVTIKVDPGKESHPLAAMFHGKNFTIHEEIYQFKDPYSSDGTGMLLRLDTGKTDMKLHGVKRADDDFGVSWTRAWGAGRVFYCSLGHNHDIYWNEAILRHYLAGIQWALGDLSLPAEKK